MNILFVAYNAASNPIMESQGISYMSGLFKKGARYSLITFEDRGSLANSKNFMAKLDMPVEWKYLIYHRKFRFLATCYDIVSGMLAVMAIIKKNKINIVHARGFIAAIIAFLPVKICGIKLFFDTRGFLADKYVCGGLLTKESFIYKIMKQGEDVLIRKSDYLTVETNRHAELLSYQQKDVLSKMATIPCCVDVAKFNYSLYPNRVDNELGLVFIGKVGTWYLIENMLDFFVIMLKKFKNSYFTFITESPVINIHPVAIKKGINLSRINVIKADRSAVPALLSAQNIGIFFMNTYEQYSFCPIKFGEYLSCGLPVIINAGIGDCDDIVLREDVGVVINGLSKDEYERAVNKLESLLSEGDILRERCRAVAEKYFSLDMGVEKYWKIYRRLGGQ